MENMNLNDSIVAKWKGQMRKTLEYQEDLAIKKLEIAEKFQSTGISEIHIIVDLLYSEGGKDGKIPAEVWNKSEFGDGRKDSISIEDAYKEIDTYFKNKAIKEQVKKLQEERLKNLQNEEIDKNAPKWGE